MMSKQQWDDSRFMARAIALAKKGLYTTDPNPRVGCVLVKNDEIIAEGWHVKAGSGHAEVEALNKTGDARGATAYVSLEPCCHQGRTPPCCDALIHAGIKTVVVAMKDPNPLVSGKGLAKLQASGLEVRSGILQHDAEALNTGFINRMLTGRPFVRSKLAMSIDGRTAVASGDSKWITSAESRQDVHRLRAQSSAILTGIDTVLADDPAMTARINEDVVQPIRIILDSKLRIPVNARILSQEARTLVITCSEDQAKIDSLAKNGIEVFVEKEDQGRVELDSLLEMLGKLQINELMVESGPTLNGALMNKNLVDEWIIYMAPCILGDKGRELFKLPNLNRMEDKIKLGLESIRHIGPDVKFILH